MSSRQIRRLHHLIKSSTGIDDETPEDISIGAMKPTASSKDRRRRNGPQSEKGGSTSAAPLENKTETNSNAVQSPITSESRRITKDNFHRATKCPSERATDPKAGDHKERMRPIEGSTNASSIDRGNPALLSGVEYSPVGMTHSQDCNAKRWSKGSKKTKRDVEEEILLEAVLRERNRAQGETGDMAIAGPHQPEICLGVLMLLCEPEHLDMRLERIRNFGVEAVEDVGDGSTMLRPHGRLRNSSSVSLFPEHHMKLSFRHSVFATPSKYRWPPFDSLGIQMVVANTHPKDAHSRENTINRNRSSSSAAPTLYRLNCDSTLFKQAEDARLACEARIGNPQDLINCLNRGPYHIPTLLQLYATFRALGNTVRASEMVDLALYHVGVLLSRFPIAETWCKRLVPYGYRENRILFQTLQCGVHVALQRGCARTAWELSRFLLSLDPRDPCGMMLMMDYLALRAKRWVWLVEVHQATLTLVDNLSLVNENTVKVGEERGVASSRREKQQNSSLTPYNNAQIDLYLARRVSTLPSFAFSAALAKYFLERDMEQHRMASLEQNSVSINTNLSMRAGSRPLKQPQSRILRDITPSQRAMLEAATPATVMLAQAIVHFPGAAVELVERLQGVDAICKGSTVDPVWQDEILALAAGEEKQSADQEDVTPYLRSQLNHFFVSRHADLWKSAEPMKFLRCVLGLSVHGSGEGSCCTGAEGVQTPLATALAELKRSQHRYPKDKEIEELYLALREEDIMGMDSNTAIPQELLDIGALDPNEDAMIPQLMEQEDNDEVLEHPHGEDGSHSRGETLPSQQENILQLFMRTLFRWHSMDDVVLQQESRGAEGAGSNIAGSSEEDDWEDLEE
ncbi:unnamed protein product [Phytomonas sp. EM1]|nr:unnamed protein product [Phytomonas sp. EM1]|eukprot:CCW64805.1 unnamed protein product [Phytomonas sp. isolate EM1]